MGPFIKPRRWDVTWLCKEQEKPISEAKRFQSSKNYEKLLYLQAILNVQGVSQVKAR